jgi:hypothetical protein
MNGELSGSVIGGISGGTNSWSGRNILRSVLDTRKTSTGSITTGTSNYHESQYSFDVKRNVRSVTSSSTSYSASQANYSFGQNLANTSAWRYLDQVYDFVFKGKSDDLKNYNQTYQFPGEDFYGLNYQKYNATEGVDYYSIDNRALGKTKDSGSQTSNEKNATKLNDNSYLLGYQAIQSMVSLNSNKDSNSYRPQLNVSWRKSGDLMHTIDAIPNDDSIWGAKARTGQKTFNWYL